MSLLTSESNFVISKFFSSLWLSIEFQSTLSIKFIGRQTLAYKKGFHAKCVTDFGLFCDGGIFNLKFILEILVISACKIFFSYENVLLLLISSQISIYFRLESFPNLNRNQLQNLRNIPYHLIRGVVLRWKMIGNFPSSIYFELFYNQFDTFSVCTEVKKLLSFSFSHLHTKNVFSS